MMVPARLARIVQLFAEAPPELRPQALLDYFRRLPPLSPCFAEHPQLLERVPECQTPLFPGGRGGG
jgi:cysteine desulfuration protein SufE